MIGKTYLIIKRPTLWQSLTLTNNVIAILNTETEVLEVAKNLLNFNEQYIVQITYHGV